MKNFLMPVSIALLLLSSCNDGSKDKKETPASDSTSEKKTETSTPAQPIDSATMAKAWNDFKAPGEMHKWLAKSNGTWEAEVTHWMDPAAPPMKSKATVVNSMALNGLYQQSKFAGMMFDAPFEGIGTTGYDNAKKMFVSTWIDNMGSGIVYMTGSWDDAAKTLNMKGKQTDPVAGKDCDIREEYKVVDDNTHIMTMYGPGVDGKEMKMMEATFKRK